ncbi:protein NRT1/ PTR FAMILY 8.3-like [Typha latifolia]|uniref:protein NRT1/ PTR FAMILY 8.3-like n=1 Tax=Typha latifolia TaxID=4733 RepID=UPI003C2FC304
MEGEEERSLLIKSELPRNYKDEASSGAFQEPQLRRKPTDWRAPAIILGFECLNSTAYNGVRANLVLFLRTVLNDSNASNAANAATWHGTSYFTPVIGATIADTYWGNYKTIWISLITYLIGMILITLSALTLTSTSSLSEVNSSQTSSGTKKTLFFFGLYLVSFGSGVRSVVLPFGAEQFNDEKPTDRERKRSYFSYFYICFIFGGIASGTLIVWIQENIDWALGYGISTLCIILALGGFLLGTPTYHLRTPNGSPLKSICQVLVATFRKISVQFPTNSNLLYEGSSNSTHNIAQPKLAHTDEFRFLDKAATIHDSDHLEDNDLKSSWKICTVTQVEELKILLRFVPIWTTGIIYTSVCSQMNTTFIQQGSAMDTRIGSFAIPPASLSSFEVISAMASVVLYNKVLVPTIRCWFSKDLSQLQRMGIGYFLAIIAMATAAFVEWRRLESAKKDELISIAWQLPQYVIFAVTEVFIFITLMEFFYGQAPESMKSICTALALLTVSLGQYLSSLIVTLVSVTTATEGKPGWIPDDLNKGHLDYFFWSLTGLCTVNFVTYLAFAKNYTLKKVILES